MSKKLDALGDRMKGYENISRNYLTRRVPVIIRLDGKAFHTFTRGFQKPFDPVLMKAMQRTMQYLCENIQGCVFAYTQSDEITLVLTDYSTIKTDAWFGYNIQKMASIAASMATFAFSKNMADSISDFVYEHSLDDQISPEFDSIASEELFETYCYANYKGAFFDARVFSVPKDEVTNCLIWRQQDATRNSIEAVGQANFSHNQLHKKNCNMIQEMLFQEKGINWNNLPTVCKRGACCYKVEKKEEMVNPRKADEIITVVRRRWEIDLEPPIFTENREYVERWL